LNKRLQNRGTEKKEIIQKRLEVGKEEISKYHLYDYVLTNYEVEDTVQGLLSIIRAENSRVDRYQPTAKDIESLLTKVKP
jgi:guanylate kinase